MVPPTQTKLRQIKSPIALAAFGAFFVPEPLGMCVVIASAIWWLTGSPAMAQIRSDEVTSRGLANASKLDQRMLVWLHYAAFLVIGTCFLIGVVIEVRSPSHRLQNQLSFTDIASAKRLDGAQMSVTPPTVQK
jgi:hypothetical protein